MNAFHFKQFSIYHDQCAMKVGTDSVLLGAWADCTAARHILDAGTGSGILALMAAQRNPMAQITGLEIDPQAVQQAMCNANASPWGERIRIIEGDIRTWQTDKRFDCILCNPPFYTNGMQSPAALRNQARQTACLSFEDLIRACAGLLTEEGTFHVILPAESCDGFTQLCWENDLHLKEKIWVHTKENKAPKRVLLAYSRQRCPFPLGQKLVLKTPDNEPTEEYRRLTGDFYLNF